MPPTDNITIQGLDALFRKFERVQAIAILTPPMQRAVLRLQRRLATYPPPIPGSRYVRGRGWANKAGKVTRLTSEKLGSRWTTRVRRGAGGIEGVVGNNASYVRYVQSVADQANIHKGRWPTDQSVLREEGPTIVADFKNVIDAALEG